MITHAAQTTPAHQRHQAGFTMLDVMISMAIFAVGFVSVAALFPTAILLQKKTVDDLAAQQASKNATALMQARGLTLASPTFLGTTLNTISANAWTTDQKVYPIGDFIPLADRSYPTATPDPLERKTLWVPLVRDSNKAVGVNSTDVVVYVFVLQKSPDEGAYPYIHYTPLTAWASVAPTVRSYPILAQGDLNSPPDNDTPDVFKQPVNTATDPDTGMMNRFEFTGVDNTNGSNGLKVNIGDQILDCYGQVYTVTKADTTSITVSGFINPNLDTGAYPDTIWFAPPSANGQNRPTKTILTLTNAITN